MVHVRMCVRVCERELARQGDRGPSIGRRRGREEGEGDGREVPVVKRGNLSPVLCNLLGRGLPRAFIHRRAIQHLAGEKLAAAHINTFSPIFLEVLVEQIAQEATASIALQIDVHPSHIRVSYPSLSSPWFKPHVACLDRCMAPASPQESMPRSLANPRLNLVPNVGCRDVWSRSYTAQVIVGQSVAALCTGGSLCGCRCTSAM
jgi:hypothetical protein